MRYRCLICGHEWESEVFPKERQCSNCHRKRVTEIYRWERAVDKVKEMMKLKPNVNPLEALDDFLEVANEFSPQSSFRSFLRGEFGEALSDPLLAFKVGYRILAEARQKMKQEEQLGRQK